MISVLILLTAFPVGYLLAKLTREELISGRFWFSMIILVAIITAVINLSFIKDFEFRLVNVLTLLYITIVSCISLWKSFDKKFVKKH